MATFTNFECLVADVPNGVHNFASDQLAVALITDGNEPNATSNTILADIAANQINYTNCSSRNITTTSSSQSSGVYKLILEDLVITATGGALPAFRYVVIYNDDSTSDSLICYYDYGSALTLNENEHITIDLDNVNGLFGLSVS